MPSNSCFTLDAYGYNLPPDLIAQYPLQRRESCRLMVIDRRNQSIRHDVFKNIAQYLPAQTTLVINNSKVIPARLLGRRVTGGAVEAFLLKGLDGYSFEALLRPLKKIKEGEVVEFAPGIRATLVNKQDRIIRFNTKNILKHLKDVGHIPLPPYIKRGDEKGDHSNYQTVYAKHLGSVASPTAGLHFTKPLMAGLKSRGHCFKELTLHINYGTFKPVESADIRQHPMHSEGYELSEVVYKVLLKLKAQGHPVAAVGTTSCRVLETVAGNLGTCARYVSPNYIKGETDIFIYPGYNFKMVDILITNFHLPHSTLLMLVTAFGGYDLIMNAYKEAIKQKYRFYSYGDAMLIV